MKRVILLYGNPGNGKSTLTNRLKDQHGFHVISVDDEYVGFIESVHPLVFFRLLGHFIAQHYQTIFSRTSSENVQGWHQHLLQMIRTSSGLHDAVVVEGFLLYDCKDQFEVALKEESIQVYQIKAEGFGYVVDGPRMTAEDVAALGLDGYTHNASRRAAGGHMAKKTKQLGPTMQKAKKGLARQRAARKRKRSG